MIQWLPAERWLVTEGNLSTHDSRDVKTALLSWLEPPIQFLPRHAPRVNRTEPG